MTDRCEGITLGAGHMAELKAQVMTRDDSTGGWIPMVGGGLSTVTVQRREITDDSDQTTKEFVVLANRLSDDAVIMNCIIKADLEYHKVMPTFHHWKTGEKKYGLTFQSLAEANGFQKAVLTAFRELTGGTEEKPPRPHKKRTSELDNNETLELPVSGVDSHSASDPSLRDSSQTTPQEQAAQMSQSFNSESESPTQSDKYDYQPLSIEPEYVYPSAGASRFVPPLPVETQKKKGRGAASRNKGKSSRMNIHRFDARRCRFCHELFVEEDNRRGACEYAPDCMRTTTDEVSCMRTARCMVYHCMSNEEGEFTQHPCECTCENGGTLRWIGLALLSIFVPCLCLYPALRSCHWCSVKLGWCGGRHRPAS